MDPGTASVEQLVSELSWKTLTTAFRPNAVFPLVLKTKEIHDDLFNEAKLSFAPGLESVLRSSHPPTVEYLRRLPSDGKGVWGIYLILMEKPLFRPRVYIGSATDKKGGVRQRWWAYNVRAVQVLPAYVEASFHEGYTITHKGFAVLVSNTLC